MKKLSLCISVLFLSGCAELQKSIDVYNARNAMLDRPSQFSAPVQKEVYELIDKTTAEIELKLKNIFIGEKYINTQPLCDSISLENYKLLLKAYDENKQEHLQGRRGSFENQTLEFQKMETSKFKPLSKVTIKDIKVVISPSGIDSKYSESNKKWMHKWGALGMSGVAIVYLLANQGADDFVVREHVSGFSEPTIDNIKTKIVFFDSNETSSNTIDCLSKSNPISKFKLSKMDLNSISENSYYLGMRSTPLILSKGRPEKINSTTSKYSYTAQWIYRNTYIYFRNGIISSWQN